MELEMGSFLFKLISIRRGYTAQIVLPPLFIHEHSSWIGRWQCCLTTQSKEISVGPKTRKVKKHHPFNSGNLVLFSRRQIHQKQCLARMTEWQLWWWWFWWNGVQMFHEKLICLELPNLQYKHQNKCSLKLKVKGLLIRPPPPVWENNVLKRLR